MAVEFKVATEAAIEPAVLAAFFADAIGGDADDEATVFRDGMYVTSRSVPEDDMIAALGFDQKTRATFRFANLASEATEDHNTALMVGAVIGLFDRFGGRGLLLFNGERVVAERVDGELVFADDWADWLTGDEVAAVVAERPVRKLTQILL